MSPNDMNAVICKAVGVNPADVSEVRIRIRAGTWPSVTVTSAIKNVNELEVPTGYVLKLEPKDPESVA